MFPERIEILGIPPRPEYVVEYVAEYTADYVVA